jgi:L-iditol 2-dehydrogenase
MISTKGALAVGLFRPALDIRRIFAIRPDSPWAMTDQYPGDRVAIEPGVPCGSCFLCMDGRYNLCEDVQFAGVYPYHGTLQRYKTHPGKWCHKLPSTVSFSEGALLEPLSVVMHGIQSAGLSLGRGAVICGAGPIGLIALKAARASGAHPLVITDLDEGRLEFAKTIVPQCKTYRVNRDLDAEGNAREIRELFDFASVGEYGAPETVLECTGVESSVVTACYTARRGGTVMVIGVGREIMNNLPFMHLSLAEVSCCDLLFCAGRVSVQTQLLSPFTCRSIASANQRYQIDLRFINRYRDTWPAGLQCLEGSILDLKPLVSHTFPLEQALNALHTCADLSNGSIKVQVVDDRDDVV